MMAMMMIKIFVFVLLLNALYAAPKVPIQFRAIKTGRPNAPTPFDANLTLFYANAERVNAPPQSDANVPEMTLFDANATTVAETAASSKSKGKGKDKGKDKGKKRKSDASISEYVANMTVYDANLTQIDAAATDLTADQPPASKKAKKEETYNCRFCERSYKSKQGCGDHERFDHLEHEAECMKCHRTFRSRQMCYDHRIRSGCEGAKCNAVRKAGAVTPPLWTGAHENDKAAEEEGDGNVDKLSETSNAAASASGPVRTDATTAHLRARPTEVVGGDEWTSGAASGFHPIHPVGQPAPAAAFTWPPVSAQPQAVASGSSGNAANASTETLNSDLPHECKYCKRIFTRADDHNRHLMEEHLDSLLHDSLLASVTATS